jgi:hypothetical protein
MDATRLTRAKWCGEWLRRPNRRRERRKTTQDFIFVRVGGDGSIRAERLSTHG